MPNHNSGNNSNQNNQQGSNPQQGQQPQQANIPASPAPSGLDPSPNPKVVVKSVNPPITPDQVVSMAEAPSAVQLPEIKLQNIKIPPVKNKTIQGHLKAIEAKMIATEKLMKDIVKLQKVQIHTEKELHERRRELYQNTFEEYLLDKTIDFGDPDDPDCTCINLPKKPPGGGPPTTGGRRGNRPKTPTPTAPAPVVVPKPAPGNEVPGTYGPPTPGTSSAPAPKPVPERRPQYQPGFEFPWWIFGPLFNPGYETAQAPTAQEMENFLVTGSYSGKPVVNPTTGKVPVQSPKPPTIGETIASNVVKGFTNPKSIAEATGLPISSQLENSMSMATMVSPTGFAPATVKALPSLVALYRQFPSLARFFAPQVPAAAKVPSAVVARQRLLNDPLRGVVPQAPTVSKFRGVSDDLRLENARRIAAASSRGPAGGYGANIPTQNYSNIFRQAAPTADDVARTTESFTGRTLYETPSEIITNTDLNKRILERLFSSPSPTRESTRSAASRVFGNSSKQLDDGITEITGVGGKKASGGINDLNLYSAESQEYFRNLSSNMEIPKFGDGGFFGGLMDTFGGIRQSIVNRINRGALNPFGQTKVSSGAAGRARVPVYSGRSGYGPMVNSPGRTAYASPDLRTAGSFAQSNQLTKGSSSVPRGGTVYGTTLPQRYLDKYGSRSMQGFRQVKMSSTAANRAFSAATGGVARSPMVAPRPTMKPSTNPLILLGQLIWEELANPRPAGMYDQISGPNAYYNAPGYKGPKPSGALENAQDNMRSGSNNNKPEIMPLPPDYIKIPGKPQPKQDVGIDVPGIDMPSSIFTRSSVYLD